MTDAIEPKVRGFRGIERADFLVDPIALVGGPNGSGKTSIAQAVGAVLTGDPLPVRGVKQSAAGVMVRSGLPQAAATVQSEGGTGRVDWPACTYRTAETPPAASKFAAGLVSVVDPGVDRSAVLSDYLKSTPTVEDLRAEIARHSELAAGADQLLDKVCDLIAGRGGFDGAAQVLRENGQQTKGRWRQATGENWGSRKAAGYRTDLDTERRPIPELVADVEAKRQAFEKAIWSDAVSGDNRKRLEQLAATADDRATALQAAEAAAEIAQGSVETAQAARAQCLPAVEGGGEMACPHCGALTIMRRADLAAPPVLEKAPTNRLSEADIKARRLAIAGADGDLSRVRGELGTANRLRADADHALQEALDAKRTLESRTPAAAGGEAGAARSALGEAEKYLADVRTKREADGLRDQITVNETLIEIVAADGLRARKLAEVLEAFNSARLAPLTEGARWAPVTVDRELEFAYGGRPYALLSASEQFRLRVVVQVAMAQLDNSAMVVIDGADILDSEGRQGLFALLSTAEIPALVTMTAATRDRLPELAAHGLGRSYWLDRGILWPRTPAEVAA